MDAVADKPKLAQASPRRRVGNKTSLASESSTVRRAFALPRPSVPSKPATALRSVPPPPLRPLLPVTERRSSEEKSGAVAPDGSSVGREGRQFAVANVGNNGRIYLRPTVRPANQRYPQPVFTFPITPPSTGGLDSIDRETSTSPKHEHDAEPPLGQSTPTPSSSPFAPELHHHHDLIGSRSPPRPTRQRRAMSDSTVDDADRDAYRVIIARPGLDKRPRTMEDFNSAATPLLHVDIPSWRIGTPRFTLRGTPIIRGSSYAPSEELWSGGPAVVDGVAPRPLLRLRNLGPPAPAATTPVGHGASRSPVLSPSAYTPPHFSSVIEPAMFSALTFKPACDDPSVVRYSPSGAVQAATPSRLVAEITSPSFLDYELISDFFLTFRAFLDSGDLLRMLMARLRWALARDDEVGMIVRVRTFVAVRHWILNYFVDDFVLHHGLRVMFCDLLNQVVDGLPPDESYRKVRLKILAELKKCWRRVCAEYWDGPQFGDSLSPEAPIAPGGLVGSRNPNLEPGFWEREGIQPPQPGALAPVPILSTIQSASLYVDARGTAPISDFAVLENRPGTPDNAVLYGPGLTVGPNSPLSLASLDIFSCSFPAKAPKATYPSAAHRTKAHPVPSTAPVTSTVQVATIPRALTGKRVRPTAAHRRNNSTSDSLRERGSEKSSTHDADFVAEMPPSAGGNLVRGNLLPPGQPFVEYELNRGSFRQTTLFRSESRDLVNDKAAASGAMTSRGMRKLLGSVRRALRSRAQGASPWQNHLQGASPVGHPDSTTNRMPGTAVVPPELPRPAGGRPPVRIDLLGAEVAEDFKKAIREEEAAAEAERLGMAVPPNSAPPFGGPTDYSAAHMEFSSFDSLPRPRPVSDMGITGGSKSIVIVDDTIPCEMTPAQRPVVDNSTADSFMPSRAGPTPPDTPPASSPRGDEPWRSSLSVGQQGTDGPAAVNDVGQLRVLDDQSLLSLPRCRRMRNPPASGGTFRKRKENRSIADQSQSLDSIIHDPASTFGGDGGGDGDGDGGYSSPVPPPSSWCFGSDVEVTESLMADDSLDAPEPAPLRVLRRRPGGDLRAAKNVGDLEERTSSPRRSRSFGSRAAYTESVRSSLLVSTRPNSAGQPESVVSHARQGRHEVLSLGQLAEKPTTAHLSLFNAHSSKPVMRASFEKEAQMLAQIPDEDDGGIESALLKLEGKYEKRPTTLPAEPRDADVEVDESSTDGDGTSTMRRRERKENRHVHVVDEAVAIGPDDDYERRAPPRQNTRQDAGRKLATDVKSFLSEGSHESYYSIPLLERGLSDGRRSKTATWEWTERSLLRNSGEEDVRVGRSKEGDEGQSEPAELTNSVEAPAVEDQSFLYDDTNGTDLSSELSAGATTSELFPAPIDDSRRAVTVHALQTPPLSGKPDDEAGAQVAVVVGQNHLPTPELSPAPRPCQASSMAAAARQPTPAPAEGSRSGLGGPLRNYSVHLPFILAFDSDILAQQLTLIEKDALSDIDWKELIDMKWKKAVRTDPRSWVDFLRRSDAQGVEVVIARFNIMVKWAISEIVLTQRAEERARCIVKLIHVASHCRRYRNFATLVQLTIALSSSEVTRLKRTWELVPGHEVETFHGLEKLVTPTRNFYAIRAEMEAGSDAGCIPFVGVYTHDLMYNDERPSPPCCSPHSPLVNFERYRVGASVVKTLLRLLEASTRYDFRPVEGVTERCLWIGALSDEEIRARSRSLERS
ncbi:hypothetical protein L249_6170 [Ophiocordyceps polyrhachis-furcata BCC 54312]|uniref:Ras-GEF domain-containing protein n=1 Tax=Ophiocordyceps polyrhachis-furcata BCC 54312 TaxID=1330021 RepID=A0A367LIK4_9HYPO|nr:hypothetical protein L249_6170 [Ophiocordyceps polyrhachis-furcata BCC 54312]